MIAGSASAARSRCAIPHEGFRRSDFDNFRPDTRTNVEKTAGQTVAALAPIVADHLESTISARFNMGRRDQLLDLSATEH